MRTPAVVKCTVGVVKARWMCLNLAGGKLLDMPEKARQIFFNMLHIYIIEIEPFFLIPVAVQSTGKRKMHFHLER